MNINMKLYGTLHVTNNGADQLYDWPTAIQLIHMYGGIQTHGGHTDV